MTDRSASPNDEEVWNRASLFERVDGNQEVFQIVVQAFLEDTPPLLETAKVALELNDYESMARAVHQLAGSSANVGALELSKSARELLSAARREDWGACREGIPRLLHTFDRLRNLMRSAE